MTTELHTDRCGCDYFLQNRDMAINKGFIWTVTDARTNKPVVGMKQLFAFNRTDGVARFRKEYGQAFDTVAHYLVGDSFSQWD